MKQAKEEAKDEIKKFQADRDAEFKKIEASIMGGSDNLQSLINAKTKKEIEEMNKRVAAQQKQVLLFNPLLFQKAVFLRWLLIWSPAYKTFT